MVRGSADAEAHATLPWPLDVPNREEKALGPDPPVSICTATCGRDVNAARVLLRWLEAKLSGVTPGMGREPSEVWSGWRVRP